MVDLVYAYAKFKYECANYSEASEYPLLLQSAGVW